MKARSPLLGYNHNVRYAGRLYHVQTEDSGLNNPHVFTHLFFGGTILASKRTDYKAADPDNTVQKMMQAQHKAMLKDLRAGAFDPKIEKHFGEPVVRDVSELEPHDSQRITGSGDPGQTQPSIPRMVDEPPPAPAPPPIDLGPPPLPPAPHAPTVAAPIYSEPVPTHVPAHAVTPQVAPPPSVIVTQPPPSVVVSSPPRPQTVTPPAQPAAPPVRRPTSPIAPYGTQPPPHQRASDLRPSGNTPTPPPPNRNRQTMPNIRPAFAPPSANSPARPGPPAPAPARRAPASPRPQPSSPYGNKPSAEGVVVARPAVIVSDVVASRPPSSRAPSPPPSAPAHAAPPPAAREPVVENIFGEDLVSEKSLDEVILAYLSEDLPGKP